MKIDRYNTAIISITLESITRGLFLLPYASLFHAIDFIKKGFSKKHVTHLLYFCLINTGMFISRLFFSESILIDYLYVTQFIIISSFLIYAIANNKFNDRSILLASYLYLPHFIYLVGGILFGYKTSDTDGRFFGLSGDANYLCMEILVALISQCYLLFSITRINRKLILLSLCLSLLMLLETGSRTGFFAFTSGIIILYVARFNLFNKFINIFYLFAGLIVTIPVAYFIFKYTSLGIFLLNRLLQDTGGGSLYENERYNVWLISYDLIVKGSLFHGPGRDYFLKNSYHFLSHNVFLDIGIRYGALAFFSSVIFTVGGLIAYISRYLLGYYKFGINLPTFFLALCCSELVLMNSISVSDKFLFSFVSTVIFVYGFIGIDFSCSPKDTC